MKTVTVRELRNEFPRIEAWLHEGESVSISKRGKIIAMLVKPEADSFPKPLVKPDIMARLKETWGSRVFTQAEIDTMRADELEGDQG